MTPEARRPEDPSGDLAGPEHVSEDLLWLALLPSWTDETASAAGFPCEDIEDFVDDAVEAGWAERRGLRSLGLGRLAFWARTSLRLTLISTAVRQGSRTAVFNAARTIAERLRTQERWQRPPTRAVLAWIDLVLSLEGDGAAKLAEDVSRLVRRDELDQALELIAAAQALEPVTGQPLTDLVQRAQRMVHLGYRQRHDAAALTSFVRREEQLTAVQQLLDDPGDRWALHVLGIGGTGKTMLARYLTSGLFAEDRERERFPVARVDFDRLSPNYPVRRPLLLLLELAGELEPYAEAGEQERALSTFYGLTRSFHAAESELSAGAPRDDRDELYDKAVSAFASLIREWDRAVLVILDTCEELAKVYPAGSASPPAVVETFKLLERVHEGAPSLRVMFAGRRPMTRGGAGWTLRASEQDSWLLPAPDYLRGHEILGFTAEEARALLRGDGEPAPSAQLVQHILERSAASGRVLQPDDVEFPEPRYNPFKLAEFRRWWQSDPELDVAALERAGDDEAYVESRIVSHLAAPLVGLLPAVAELGRFDEMMLEAVVPDADLAALRRLMDELATQEWIDIDTDPLTGSRILQVEELLRPDLLDWAHRPVRVQQTLRVRGLLRDRLTGQLGSADLDTLSADHVVNLLRLSDVEHRRKVWQIAERRVAVADRWDWMENVIARVLGELEGEQDPVLLAQLQITSIAMHRRRALTNGSAELWALAGQTLAGAGGNTEPRILRRLRLRAELGIAATRGRPSTVEEVDRLRTAISQAGRDGALAGSVVAAIEGVAERTPSADLQPLNEVIGDWLLITEDRAVRAALRLLAARLLRPGGDDLVTTSAFASASAAAQEAREASERPGDGRWADWLAPANCLAWVLLHDARGAFLGGRHLSGLPIHEWEEIAQAHLDTVDGERLMSQCLQLRLGFGVVRRETLDRLAVVDRYDPARTPRRVIHEAVPPLFVSVSDGYLALGDAQRAMDLLQVRRAVARGRRQEDVTLRHADEALTELARRLRVDLDRAVNERIGRLSPQHRHRSWAARTLVEGVAPADRLEREQTAEGWHACWEAQHVNPVSGRLRVPRPRWLSEGLEPAEPLATLLRWDAAEAAAIGEGEGRALLEQWRNAQPDPVVQSAGRQDDEWPLRWLRYQLILAEDARVLDDLLRPSYRPLPPPLVIASMALEVGELRALRRPAEALHLLDFAARLAAPSSPVLAMQASTAYALALVHAGRTGGPNIRKLGLADAYKRFRMHLRDQTVVPPWEQLVQTDPGISGPWRGWLMRVRIASLAIAERPRPGWTGGPVELYGGQFGKAYEGESRALTSGTTSSSWPSVSRVPTGRRDPSPMLSRVRRNLSTVAVWTATISYSGGSRWVHLAYDAAPAGFTRHRLTGAVGRRILRLVASIGAVDKAIEMDQSADRLPDLRAHVDQTGLGLRGRQVPGRLVVVPEEQSRPWEETIAEATGTGRGSGILWYRPWPSERSAVRTRWQSESVRVYLPSQYVAMVERGYAPVEPVELPDGIPVASPLTEVGLPEASVVHLVGQAVSANTGVLFQVSDRRMTQLPGDEAFLAPDEVDPDRAALVVVQGMPYDGELRVDPFESGMALQFAVDTMVAGAWAVLLVPAVPIPAAQRVFRHLSRFVAAGAPSPSDLLGLAADVKQSIDLREVEGSAKDKAAVAQQVRLFMVERGGVR